MTPENEGIVLHGKYDLRLEKLPIPKPLPNEVLLEMACVGICGSDITHWKHFAQGTRKITTAKVMGHEPSGTVIAVGENVKHLTKGDRVAVEPGIPCSKCEYCKVGTYNHCSNVIFSGVPPKDGALQKYYAHDANFVHKLPQELSFEEGALLQPLAIAVHAVKRAGVTGCSKVLIVGAGTIGLSVLQTAKAYGATKTIISDFLENRLKKAKELGADFTYKVDPNDSDETTLQNMLKIFGEEPTVSFDCAGVESSVKIALSATKNTGVMVIVGMGTPNYTLPIFDAQCKEVDIRGSFRLCNDYPEALNLVLTKKVNMSSLVTHRFKLEDFAKAFSMAEKREDNSIKVMFVLN